MMALSVVLSAMMSAMGVRLAEGLEDSASSAAAEMQFLPKEATTSQDAVNIIFPPHSADEIQLKSFNTTVKSTGRWYVAHSAILPDPRRFSIDIGEPICSGEQKTSLSA